MTLSVLLIVGLAVAEDEPTSSEQDSEVSQDDSEVSNESASETAEPDATVDEAAPEATEQDAAIDEDARQVAEQFSRERLLDLIDEMRQWPAPIKREILDRSGIDIDELASGDIEDVDPATIRRIKATWSTAAELSSASFRTGSSDDSNQFGAHCPLGLFCTPRLDCLAEGLDLSICEALTESQMRGAILEDSSVKIIELGRSTRPNTERFIAGRARQWRTTQDDFIFRTKGSEVIDELIRRTEAATKETVLLQGYLPDIFVNPEDMTIDFGHLLQIESEWNKVRELEDAVAEIRVHVPEQLLNLRQRQKYGTLADMAWLVGTEASKALRLHTNLTQKTVRIRVAQPESTETAPTATEEEGEEEQLSTDLINPIAMRVEILFFYNRSKDLPEPEKAELSEDESAEGDSPEGEPKKTPSAAEKQIAREEQLRQHRVAVCHVEQLCLVRRSLGKDSKVQLRNLVPNLPADQYRNPRSSWIAAVREAWLRYRDRPGAQIRLIGHTDSEEIPEAIATQYSSAKAYSQFQAQVVAGILLQRLQLKSKNLSIAGFGPERLLVSNDSALNRATNRRIEVEIWYGAVADQSSLPSEPQVCPNRSEEERIYLEATGEQFGIKNIILPIVNGQPQLSDKNLAAIKKLLSENSDKENPRLYFLGHTDKRALLRRVAKVYGDHFGLSRARALNALRQVAEKLRLNANTMLYQGFGYLEPLVDVGDSTAGRRAEGGSVSPFDLIVEDDEASESETQVNDRVEVKVIYDQIARIQKEFGLRADEIEIERIEKPTKPVTPYLTNIMRVTVDGIPVSDRKIHLADIQRCTDVALADAGVQFKFDAFSNRKRLHVSSWPKAANYLDDPASEVIDNRVHFRMHSNYSHWIKQAEVRIFYADQTVESEPLAIVTLNQDGYGVFDASIYMAREPVVTELKFVGRVYHREDNFDETIAQRMRLLHNSASNLWIERYGHPPTFGSLDYGRPLLGAPLPGVAQPIEEEEVIEDLQITVAGKPKVEVPTQDEEGEESEVEEQGSDDATEITEEQNLESEGEGSEAEDTEATETDETDAEAEDPSIEGVGEEPQSADIDNLDETTEEQSGESDATATETEVAEEVGSEVEAQAQVLEPESDSSAEEGAATSPDEQVEASEGTTDADADAEDPAESAPQDQAQLTAEDEAELLKAEQLYDYESPLVIPAISDAPERQKISEIDRHLLAGYGESTLAKDNIEVYGGVLTAKGNGVPSDHQIWMVAKQVPLSQDGKFVAEEIIPYGVHTVEIAVVDEQGRGNLYLRNLRFDKHEWFYAGLFDLTLGFDSTDGPADILSQDTIHYNNSFFIDGQIGFYARGNLGENGLFKFSIDTDERPLQELFSNVVNKDPQLLLSRLDDRQHYATFGDDSEIVDDTPSQGRLFLRYEKNKSFVQWGDQSADLVTTDLAQIDSSVYGLYSRYASDSTTKFGEDTVRFDIFAADAGTLSTRDEFRSTGGSLYVLSQRNIARGTARLRIEVRDLETGLTVSSNALSEGSDYDIDYIQGRVILLSPLSSSAQQSSLVRSGGSLGGDLVYLVVRYDYTPGFSQLSHLEYGSRVAWWIDEQWQIGTTFGQRRNFDTDSRLFGTDLQWRHSSGTWIRWEFAETDGLLPNQTVSLDGGFSRGGTENLAQTPTNASAWRMETSLQFSDLGEAAGSTNFYFQTRKKGFSAPGQIAIDDVDQYGISFNIPFGIHRITTNYERYDETLNLDSQAVSFDYSVRLPDGFSLSSGLRYDERSYNLVASEVPTGVQGINASTTTGLGGSNERGERLDGILRMDYSPNSVWGIYTFYQGTLSKGSGRRNNDLYGIGGSAAATDRATFDYEVNNGASGAGGSVGMDFLVGEQSNIYVTYRQNNSIQSTGSSRNSGNVVTGFRTRVQDSLSIYGEERYSDDGTSTGLTHAYGIDYSIDDYWGFGFSFDIGELEDPIQNDRLDRQAYSTSVSYTRNITRFLTLLEYQQDKRSSQTHSTLLTRTNMTIGLSPSWRLIGEYAYSQSSNSAGSFYEGSFNEATLGFGIRPVESDIFNALFHVSLFSDDPAQGQPATSYSYNYQQETLITSLDMEFKLDPSWSLGTKFAYRQGNITLDQNGTDREFTSNALLGILRLDWHLVHRWDLTTEFRYLNFDLAGSTRAGFLLGAFYHINENFKIGVGYNFTDFTDDLLDYQFDDSLPFPQEERGEGDIAPANDSFRTQGLFINIVGKL